MKLNVIWQHWLILDFSAKQQSRRRSVNTTLKPAYVQFGCVSRRATVSALFHALFVSGIVEQGIDIGLK